ncbi:Zinc/iron permease, partial [Eremomyces bilateralis CBS 781.70]
DYDTPWHIAAVGIIFAISTSSACFPMIVKTYPRLRVPTSFLFFARHFGTGVLLAAAFVHLLTEAFVSLTSKCLSDYWTKRYPSTAGAVCLGAILLVTLVEMIFSPNRHLIREKVQYIEELDESRSSQDEAVFHDFIENAKRQNYELDEIKKARKSRQSTRFQGAINESQEDLVQPQEMPNERKLKVTEVESNFESIPLSPEQKFQRMRVQVTMLEMGVLFHGIFIGMSLSVAVGMEFNMFLVAFGFHQLFEGLALGSRIAALPWPKGSKKPWLMCLSYGATAPVGQALGVATHSAYDPSSDTGLILVGIFNAISSGLLIYAALVELLSEDFLSDESWRVLRGARRSFAFFMVFLGAFLMSLVAAWA